MFKRILFLFILFTVFSCKTGQKSSEISSTKGLFELFVEDGDRNTFYSNKKGVLAEKGMVASAHFEASEIGKEILKKGGNAVDAAVATFFALAVVHPFAGNLGGGGFAVIRESSGKNHALDFREKAPLMAHRDMYLDANGDVIRELSTLGHLASGVPGSVAGMAEMHKKLGSLKWEILLQPAIDLAKKGVALTDGQAKGMNRYKETFQKVNGVDTPYFIKPTNGVWEVGELFVQSDLAESLKRIRDFGADGFYKGITADFLVKEMQNNSGIISHDDLLKYDAIWRDPVEKSYKEYKIISMPLPSSGGIALIQLMRLVEQYPLKEWGWNTANTTQVMIEAERRVYADRAKWLGDTDFVKVPQNELMSYPYLEERWASFNVNKASKSSEINGGDVSFYESDQTTHFSVVDKNSMAVSLTTTLNGAYGSKVVVAGAGFLMNNEMDDFSVKAGVPNMFGLVGNKANEIQPEKRMLSSMTPTILEKDGQLFMVVGTPGGSTIITSVYQTILNVAEHGMGMQQAVNALKFHHQWLPDKTFFEKDAIEVEELQILLNKGYLIEFQNSTLGRMDCILVHPNGVLEGASDPRGENTSIGY